jgi:hypothetical protein
MARFARHEPMKRLCRNGGFPGHDQRIRPELGGGNSMAFKAKVYLNEATVMLATLALIS